MLCLAYFAGNWLADKLTAQTEEIEIRGLETESREMESREMGSREMESREMESREMESREMESREMESREMESREMESREMGSREMESREMGSREMGSREMASREMESREMESREMGSREMESREMGSREMESREMGSRGMESREMEKEVHESTGPRIIFPPQEVITIIETKQGAITAKTEVLALIKDLDAQVTVKCVITQQIDRRVMGGCGVRKIQEDFKVDFCFPRANDNFDVIMITGEEDVYDCKDHLLDIEEEFLQDHLNNENIQSLSKAPSRNQDSQTTRGKACMVFNAPSDDAPETSSPAKFPGFPGDWKYHGPKYKPSLRSKKILT